MASKTIDVSTMFTYSSKRNVPWNIPQYRPVRQYLDPTQIKSEDQRKQNKYIRLSQNPPQHIHQKTFFLDETIMPAKDNPSPDKYKSLSLFDQTRNRQKSKSIKINPKVSKYTYLDWIQIESKKRKKPAVGKYNLTKTQQKLKAELKVLVAKKPSSIDEKRHFYDKDQTNQVPGAGTYNPHLTVQLPPKPSRKNHKWWKEMHQNLAKKQSKKQRKSLAPTSYRPISTSFNSFTKIELDLQKQQKNKKDKKINPQLGFTTSDARFNYRKQKKIKIEQKRPNSASYNTIIQWRGKNQNSRKNNWARCLSARPLRSVYY